MIPKSLRAVVRSRAAGRCEYCLSSVVYCGCEFEVDHVLLLSAGGLTVADNLALACSHCNAHTGARIQSPDPQTGQSVRLFQPRQDGWGDHFAWSDDGTQIVGLTEVGRATVAALQMNNGAVVLSRAFWVSYGIHPPRDKE